MGGKFDWPTVQDVVEYRKKVRNIILNVIEREPLELPITEKSPWVCAYHSELESLATFMILKWS